MATAEQGNNVKAVALNEQVEGFLSYPSRNFMSLVVEAKKRFTRTVSRFCLGHETRRVHEPKTT